MERLENCEIIMDIELIDKISGGDQYFEVLLTTRDKAKYKIILKHVWDLRYSIENASIDRWHYFRKCLSEDIIDNGVYVVENSEYIKYFENQVSGTRPVDTLKHYIFSDNIDTILDVLMLEKPILVEMEE